jgi:hypothetical protein
MASGLRVLGKLGSLAGTTLFESLPPIIRASGRIEVAQLPEILTMSHSGKG